jgi:cell wall-associated NlpC family hydrolase
MKVTRDKPADSEPKPFFPVPVHACVDAALERFQRARVIEAALSWVGTPYRQLGYTKGPQGAVDCSMLLVAALVEGRVFEPFDPRPYSPTWFLARSEEKYLAWLGTIGEQTETPQPGDVMVFHYGRCYAHSGIIIDDNYIVHAFADQRKCRRTERTWPDLTRTGHAPLYYDFWARLRT